MKASSLAPLLACCLATAGSADPPPAVHAPEPPGPSFVVQCQMISVPAKRLPELLPELLDDARIGSAVAVLQQMELRDEARLTANLLARGGAQGRLERLEAVALEEFRYASQFEPPIVPQLSLLEKPSPAALKNWPVAGILPTAFETRNLGQSLEVEITPTADPKLFGCEYIVEHARLERMNRMDAGRLPDGERLFVEQPCFSSMKDQGSLLLESGRPKLIGVHRLPGPERLFELFILTLTATPAKTP